MLVLIDSCGLAVSLTHGNKLEICIKPKNTVATDLARMNDSAGNHFSEHTI